MSASNSTGEEHQGGGNKIYEAFLEDFIDFLDLETVKKILKEITKVNWNEDKKEAVEVLVRVADAMNVLNCRCCLRDILRVYVIKRKEIKIPPCGIGKATKAQLVMAILEHWKLLSLARTKTTESKPNVADLMDNAKEEKKDVKPYVAPVPQQASVGVQSDPPALQVSCDVQTVPNFCRDIVPLYAPAQEEEEENEEEEVQQIEFPQTELERATGRQLAENFTGWFYARLNGLTDVQLQLTDLWLDCSFDMYIRLGAEVRKLSASNDGVEVLRALRSLVAEYGCYFSPDIETGIGGIYTPHGLGHVLVRGTVLKGCGGVKMASFHQSFGLVRDPNYGENFKVKYSVLNYCQEDNTNAVVNRIEEID